jgi:alpha-amylase
MKQRAICLYLHLHQPYRLRSYSVFDSGVDSNYFFDSDPEARTNNKTILLKVAEKSYRPMLKVLEELIQRYEQFSFSLSITGPLLQQLEWWAPDVLESLKTLVASGRVEIVAETFHHSLAFFYDRSEFEHQVAMHTTLIDKIFSYKPTAFRNTELAYNNDVAYWADKQGYKAILAEGWEPILGWRSPNFVYRPSYTKNIKLLLKNYHLSDDIAFRFSDKGWNEHPLTTEKFVGWLNDYWDQPLINLFMDFETFGEHQWDDSGIFDFMRYLPEKWLATEHHNFLTVTEASEELEPADTIDCPQTITWADSERDLSAWLGNAMQTEAINAVYALKDRISSVKDPELSEDWRRLQISDHFYYMCTKWFNDGDIHAYFSPYETPYDAFVYFMNAVRDLELRLARLEKARQNV